MKQFLLVFLAVVAMEFTFTGCLKLKFDCDDCGAKDTTSNKQDTTNKDTVLTGSEHAGPLRIAVRVGRVTGPFAAGAKVKLAYSFDSINAEKYFLLKMTDETGYVVFNDLPVNSVTLKKSYYANAFFTESGVEMNSTNGNGSNGPLEIRLTSDMASNQTLVVTYK